MCIVSGVTLDGKISIGPDVSSKETMPLPLKVRAYLHRLRSLFDAISVGCNTVKVDNPYLTVEYVKGKSPIRIVPCSKADVSPYSHVFREPEKAILVTSRNAPEERVKTFQERGVRVIFAGEKRVEVEKMLTSLADMGIKSLMVEGGAKLNGELISKGFLDEMVLIHHPMVVGLKDAPFFAEGEMGTPQRFNLRDVKFLEGFLITRWTPVSSPSFSNSGTSQASCIA